MLLPSKYVSGDEELTLQANYDRAEKELKNEKKSLASYDKEISTLENDKKTKKQELENSRLESQQLGHDRQGLVDERDLASKQMNRLIKENPWIPDQKEYGCEILVISSIRHFGEKNTDFYFGGQDMDECRKRLKQIEETHSKLSKTLDTDVMQKYDR